MFIVFLIKEENVIENLMIVYWICILSLVIDIFLLLILLIYEYEGVFIFFYIVFNFFF